MGTVKAEVVLAWGDGEYLFALKGAQIEHLEKTLEAGIQEIAERLLMRKARYRDIRDVIFQSLIGGGMPPVEAGQKMKAYFDGQPLSSPSDPHSPLLTAQQIITAVFLGHDPEKDKPKGEAQSPESE